MKKKILVISNYWHFPFEKSSSRYNSIIEILADKYDVELVTSNFRHIIKSQRNYDSSMFEKYNYKVKFLSEPGYKKNISLGRVISHKKFAKNLKEYLNTKSDIDVIYSFVPSLSANIVITNYCKKNNVKHIIDILDLWPEAFKMIFNVPVIRDIIFYPMTRQANYIYKNADEIVAVSQTYVDRALQENKKTRLGHSVYIGIDLKYFDECKKKNKIKFNDDLIRIAYIGTLGHSYDIKSIIDAIKILNDKGIKNIKFIVMGDGPLKSNFENYAKEKLVDCEFAGRLDYSKMVGLLCSCDICVNPIVDTSAASIINKVADYAASGLPVINTQRSEEYRNLVDKYKAGFNCKNGDANDIADNLEIFIINEKMRKELGNGNRKLAEEKFDRSITYKKLKDIIDK